MGHWARDGVFWILAGVTVVAAVGTITLPQPGLLRHLVRAALLGTAGLFLFQGAQFLGVATIVVYAGAILVTFLFVLMLAQPARRRRLRSRELGGRCSLPAPAAVLVGILTLTLAGVVQSGDLAPAGATAAGKAALGRRTCSTADHVAAAGRAALQPPPAGRRGRRHAAAGGAGRRGGHRGPLAAGGVAGQRSAALILETRPGQPGHSGKVPAP